MFFTMWSTKYRPSLVFRFPHLTSSSCLTWAAQTSNIPSAICLTCHHVVPKATAAKGRASINTAKKKGLVESAIHGWKCCKSFVQITAWGNGTIQNGTSYFCKAVIETQNNIVIYPANYAHGSYFDDLLWFGTNLFTHATLQGFYSQRRRRLHYNGVKMGAMASQITSLTIVYSTDYSGKENIKAPRHWPLCGEFTGERWIPRTNGQ